MTNINPEVSPAGETDSKPEQNNNNGHTGRKVAVSLLVILALLILTIANVTVWARYTLLNTNGWVNAVGPITQDPDVAQILSTYVVGEIYDAVDVDQAVKEMVPAEFQIIAVPMSSAIQGLVEDAVTSLIQSDAFNAVWVTVNRVGHKLVVGVLTGGGDHLYLESGQIVIDFSDAVVFIQSTFGLENLDLDIGGDGGRIVLFENQQVAILQEAISYLQTFSWLLPLLSLAGFVAAWFVSLWRRKTVLWIGIGVAVTMGLSLILFSVVESYAIVSIGEPLLREMVRAIWDVVTNGLVTQSILLMVIGVLIAIGAWVAGPSRSAVSIRSTVGGWTDKVSRRDTIED